jgi:hypothetical protein
LWISIFQAIDELVCSWCMSSSMGTLVILHFRIPKTQICGSASRFWEAGIGTWHTWGDSQKNNHRCIYSLYQFQAFAFLLTAERKWVREIMFIHGEQATWYCQLIMKWIFEILWAHDSCWKGVSSKWIPTLFTLVIRSRRRYGRFWTWLKMDF